MLNRSCNAVKSWVVVGVGALVLALSAFFILYNFSPDSTFAQEVPDVITYNENGTDPVITLTSMDPESRGITWSVMGTDAADFTISGGVLEFKNPPDYEKPRDRIQENAIDIDGDGQTTGPGEAEDATAGNNTYHIIIMVTEGRQAGDTGVAKYTKIGATVSVVEVNESEMLTLDALQPQDGRLITAMLATGDANREAVTFEWARSKVQTPIITSTAHWEVIKTGDDDTYIPGANDAPDEGKFLRVVATYDDTAATANNTARVVTMYRVRAMPDNNGSPDFPAEEHTRSVSETAKVGDPVGVNMPVAATAADSVDVGKLIYDLIEADGHRSGDAAFFDIDQYTGQITVAMTLDADTTQGRTNATAGEYVVVVAVSDPSADFPDSAGDADDTVTVTITATQQNENPRVIWSGNKTGHPDATTINGILEISIPENTNIGVGDNAANNVYGAADVDASPNINWQPNLGGDDGNLFSLSGTSTRTLTFKAMPDYEMPGDMNGDNVYEVMLVVTDGQGGRGELPLRVTVTDANEGEDAEVTLSLDQPHLDTPLTAELEVPDGDLTIIGWQWYRAPTAANFDTALAERQETQTDQSTYVIEIPGATSDTYTPTAHDNGIGNFLEARVRFIHKHSTMPPGPGGELGTDPTDFQTESAVSVHAIQAAPGTSMDPAFTASTLTREVQENAEAGDRVGAPVLAVDADSNDVLTYELGGRDMRFFNFEMGSPGQIIIVSDNPLPAGKQLPELDREDSNVRSFIVTVKATDSEGNDATATVNIVVTDVNEGPEFSNAPDAATNYDENGTGTVISLSATDPERRGVDWEVTGTDAADFTISGGALRFMNSPNFEAPTERPHTAVDINNNGNENDFGEGVAAGTNTYQIIVRATERRAAGYTGPAKSTSIGVIVAVQDLNEAGTITLNALQPQVSRPITAMIEDGDGDPTTVTWAWARSKVDSPTIDDDDHWETVGTNSNSYTPAEADAADGGKFLRAVATYTDTDLGEPANVNTVRMVTRYKVREALDNNGSPDFPSGDHTRSISETADVGDPVGVNMPVTATEHDSEDQGKLIYGLLADTENSDDNAYFSIDQYTGQIRVMARLDADTRWHTAESPASEADRATGIGAAALGNGEYRVVVTVADPAAVLPPDTISALVDQDRVVVTITATQQNENPKITGKSQYTIEENANLPTTNIPPNERRNVHGGRMWTLAPTSTGIPKGTTRTCCESQGTGDRMLAFIDEPDYEMPGDMPMEDNVYEVIGGGDRR